MPTGYTHPLLKNEKELSLREFITACSHAFVYDSDVSTESLPSVKYGMSTYYTEQIGRLTKEIDEIASWSDEETERRAAFAYAEAVSSYYAKLASNARDKMRLANMAEQVEAWEPPTPEHQGLKDFMLDQIQISSPLDFVSGPPVFQVGKDYRKFLISDLTQSLEQTKLNQEREEKNRDKSREWIKNLRHNLYNV